MKFSMRLTALLLGHAFVALLLVCWLMLVLTYPFYRIWRAAVNATDWTAAKLQPGNRHAPVRE